MRAILLAAATIAACGGSRPPDSASDKPEPTESLHAGDDSTRDDKLATVVTASALSSYVHGQYELLGATDPLEPGFGFDSLSELVLYNECVVGKLSAGKEGDHGEVTFRLAEDRSSFRESFRSSASVRARWGLASGSASFKLRTSTATNRFSLMGVIDVDIQTPAQAMTSGRISDRYAQLDPAAFRAQCGDSFVSIAREGRRFTALVSIDTDSRDDRRSLKQALDFATNGIQGAGSIKHRLLSKLRKRRISIDVVREGGARDIEITKMNGAGGLDSVLAFAERFASAEGPVTSRNFVVADYATVGGIPGGASSVGDFSAEWRELTRTEDRISDLRYALENQTQFTCPDPEAWRAELHAQQEYRVALSDNVRKRLEGASSSGPPARPAKGKELRRYQHRGERRADMKSQVAFAPPAASVCVVLGVRGRWSPWKNTKAWRKARARGDHGSENEWKTCPAVELENGLFRAKLHDPVPEDDRGPCLYDIGCVPEAEREALTCEL